jgi:hypothetical protein
MGSIKLPELPSIVARLVRGGVYTIYSVEGAADNPYVLLTSSGTIHGLSTTGRLSAVIENKRLSDFVIGAPVDVSENGQLDSVVRINNC